MYIIFRGITGSGKSTLASILENKLNAKKIETDMIIKNILSDALSYNERAKIANTYLLQNIFNFFNYSNDDDVLINSNLNLKCKMHQKYILKKARYYNQKIYLINLWPEKNLEKHLRSLYIGRLSIIENQTKAFYYYQKKLNQFCDFDYILNIESQDFYFAKNIFSKMNKKRWKNFFEFLKKKKIENLKEIKSVKFKGNRCQIKLI